MAHIQPIAPGVSFNPVLQSQSKWPLFDGTEQNIHRELKNRLRLEIGEKILQMQSLLQSVAVCCNVAYTLKRDSKCKACCSLLQCAVMLPTPLKDTPDAKPVAVCCSVL